MRTTFRIEFDSPWNQWYGVRRKIMDSVALRFMQRGMDIMPVSDNRFILDHESPSAVTLAAMYLSEYSDRFRITEIENHI